MTQFQRDPQFRIENNTLKGKEVSYDDACTGMGRLILRRLEETPDSVGQIDAVTGEEWTHGKMRERSVRCALWMRAQGLQPGDVVVLCSNNHLDIALPCFATLYLGGVFNPSDATTNTEDLRHQLNIAKPKMVFVSEDSARVVAEVAEREKLELKIIVFGHVSGFLEFENIIAEPRIDEVNEFHCNRIESPEEIALIMFSSGTTSLSKGVALSHRALGMQFRLSKALGMAGNVCLNFASVGWINGIFGMLWTVLSNTPRFVVPIFEEHSACALMEKHKATWILLSPTMIGRLLKFEALNRYDLSSVSSVIHTGASLSTATNIGFAELLPNAGLFSGYGLTELGGYASLQSTESRIGSSGRILENVQLKVIDQDTGWTLGPNEKGELLLKSSSMMTFYHDNPEDTAQAVDEEGWLHTGDFGYFDEDGEIFVIDRLKDIIRLADYDISPSEIESLILSHTGVKEVAVVGQPRPDGDDLPIAFVVRVEDPLDTNERVTESDIVNLVAAELVDDRKHLRAGVRFVDHLPKTPSNKIRRKTLRDLARTMV